MTAQPDYSAGNYPTRSEYSTLSSPGFSVYSVNDRPKFQTTSNQSAVESTFEFENSDGDHWAASVGAQDCLPGLQFLKHIDKFTIQRDLDLREVSSPVDFENKYSVKNNQDQIIYTVAESKIFLSALRNFEILVLDRHGQEVIHLNRPVRCQDCFFPCCLRRMNVTASNQIVGYIEQTWHPVFPRIQICNAQGDTVLKIKGPFWICTLFYDIHFPIYDSKGKMKIGQITKKQISSGKECCNHARDYSVHFPQDLDVNIKAVLIGAVFLIDFMYFEKQRIFSCAN